MEDRDRKDKIPPACGIDSTAETDPSVCPYCGIRFEDPLKVLQHIFREHSF